MRTLISNTVFGAFLTLSCAGVATGLDNRSPQTEEQRVLAVEDEYVSAELNRDEAALRRLVDDRFLLNSSNGSSSGKEALIRSVLGMNMTGQTITERTVMIEGDLAIIFGTAELRLEAPGRDERISVLRYTSVYVRRQGHWRMLALHMAPRSPRER